MECIHENLKGFMEIEKGDVSAIGYHGVVFGSSLVLHSIGTSQERKENVYGCIYYPL